MVTEAAHLSDRQLLSRWQREPGSAEARDCAAALLERYQQRIYRWCRRYLRDHEEALDLSQDVLLTALEKLERLPADACVGAWLYTVTRNRCLGEIRRRRVRAVSPVEGVDVPSPARDPEEELLEELDAKAFLRLVRESLDPEEQEAISLRCFDRLPVEQITVILGLTSSSGARGLLQRARRKLRAVMETERAGPRRNRRVDP